jgi:hypothetical protein
LWYVAVHGHFVAEAQQRLSTAVADHGEEHARIRVLHQISLASLVMAIGDPDKAALIGGQALDAASAMRSRRAAEYLHELRRFAEPHEKLTAVVELTHRIGSVVVL